MEVEIDNCLPRHIREELSHLLGTTPEELILRESHGVGKHGEEQVIRPTATVKLFPEFALMKERIRLVVCVLKVIPKDCPHNIVGYEMFHLAGTV